MSGELPLAGSMISFVLVVGYWSPHGLMALPNNSLLVLAAAAICSIRLQMLFFGRFPLAINTYHRDNFVQQNNMVKIVSNTQASATKLLCN